MMKVFTSLILKLWRLSVSKKVLLCVNGFLECSQQRNAYVCPSWNSSSSLINFRFCGGILLFPELLLEESFIKLLGRSDSLGVPATTIFLYLISSPTFGPSQKGRKQRSSSFVFLFGLVNSAELAFKLELQWVDFWCSFGEFGFWLESARSPSPLDVFPGWIEAVSSHQSVLRSLQIRRTWHDGASGDTLLTVQG